MSRDVYLNIIVLIQETADHPYQIQTAVCHSGHRSFIMSTLFASDGKADDVNMAGIKEKQRQTKLPICILRMESFLLP